MVAEKVLPSALSAPIAAKADGKLVSFYENCYIMAQQSERKGQKKHYWLQKPRQERVPYLLQMAVICLAQHI